MTIHNVATSRLTHDALLYDSSEAFLETLVPFARDGIGQGHAVIAALPRSNIDLLRQALDGDAASVAFIDRDDWYRRPAATIAGWHRLLAEADARGQTFVRIIGEVAFGPPNRHTTWTRYEAALNRLFTSAPAWIVCPYDTTALTPDLLTSARRTHPTVYDPRRRPSGPYTPPENLLREIPEPLPPAAGEPVAQVALRDAGDLSLARQAVRAVAAGWPPDRLEEFLLAVTEIAGNCLRHGTGERLLQLWHLGDAIVCEVSDDGPGITDPFIGLAPPSDHLSPGGWGLWITHQLCDVVAIDRHDGRTRVRLEASPT